MTENQIATEIVDAAYHIHKELGPGLLEHVYETVLAAELAERGLTVSRQVTAPVLWKGMRIEEGLRMDILVEDKVIVEVKAIEKALPVHKRQLTTYLKMADKRLGLLINFGAHLIKDGITRIANGLPEM